MRLRGKIKTVAVVGVLGLIIYSKSGTTTHATSSINANNRDKILVSDTYEKAEVTLNKMIESGELDQYIEGQFKLYKEAEDQEKMRTQKEQLRKFEKAIEDKLQRASYLTFNEDTIYATLPVSLDGKNTKIMGNNFNISYGVDLSYTDAVINEEEMTCTLVIPVSAVGLYTCSADANFERLSEDLSWWFKHGWGHYEKAVALQEEATHQLMLTTTADASDVSFEELKADAETAITDNVLASAIAIIDSGLADCSLYIQWVDDRTSTPVKLDRILITEHN